MEAGESKIYQEIVKDRNGEKEMEQDRVRGHKRELNYLDSGHKVTFFSVNFFLRPGFKVHDTFCPSETPSSAK